MRTPVSVTPIWVLALAVLPACDAPAADRAPPPERATAESPAADGTDGPRERDVPGARGEDEAEVEAVVRGLFDAMRDADSAAARALFHPDARLSGPVEKEGEVLLRTSPVGPFLEAVGGAEEQWDERIADLEIRVHGRLATAWMDYVFHLGGDLSHCGVNAMQLYRSTEGWKIFQIADTRRTDGCPDLPPGAS